LFFRQNSGFQELNEQSIHFPVDAVPSHPIHQQVVIDIVETALDIAFNDPLIGDIVTFAVRFACAPRPHCHTDVFERAMTSPSWPKAIRDMPESRFQDWFQKLFDRALNDTVGDRRNPQGSELPRFALFWNKLSAARTGTVPPQSKLALKLIQIGRLAQFAANTPHGLSIDTWRLSALILGNPSPGTSQIADIG